MNLYGDEQRALQEQFDCVNLAAALEATIVTASISDDQRRFIESRDFCFLSTVGADGWPTVSYKGGPVGMVAVEDDHTLVMPSYDGNGMFLSTGNIAASAKIGLLFIDMETPQRLRVQATATADIADPAIQRFPGAQLIIRAHVEAVFPNCARYIHPHQRVADSRYVPTADGHQPLPAWKKIDLLQPVLPASDQGRAAAEGGTITADEYQARLASGTS
jgi:predicted pyridoxine 5'-phosphate oxidase superfamily flavin-nucleotide-binding protein